MKTLRTDLQTGALTIEASLALPFFLAGFIAILSLAAVVRTECAVAGGVNQTAAEIARYCYITQRISDSEEGALLYQSLDDVIKSITDLSSLNSQDKSSSSDTGSLIKSLTMLTSNRAANNLLGCKMTDMMCRGLISKYIGENRESADSFLLKSAGITLDDIDFRGSGILKNSGDVNIIAVYKVHINTFGLLDSDRFTFVMENSACVHAWGVRALTDEETYESSKWMLSNFKRGQAWAAQIKSEHPGQAVCAGDGVDLYDSSCNTFTQIYSVNIFAQSYTQYEAGIGISGADCYELKKDYFEKYLEGCAGKIIKNINGISAGVPMESGTAMPSLKSDRQAVLLFVMPQETQYNQKLLSDINIISDRVSRKTGVKTEYIFREKALLMKENKENS